jgi:glycosyltransferase involved in cell wall biosynthesis
MRLSFIIATRNRKQAICGCLDSIAASVDHAGLNSAEIVVVDNGSTDGTSSVVAAWASANRLPVQLLHEPKAGASRARNLAVRHAGGDLLVFTDDDCRLDPAYVSRFLAYDAADTGLVLRGGLVTSGDSTDLPLSVTPPAFRRWHRDRNPPRHENIGTFVLGCNMAMRRALAEHIGFLDPDFGPGARIGSGEDHEYVFRAYCAGVTIEVVPDMAVSHHHGRKDASDGNRLMRSYMVASGAIYAKYFLKSPILCRQVYWDCKNAAREIIGGTNLFLPGIGFSNRDKVTCYVRGAARYAFVGRHRGIS